jgi:hypothetical protein
MTTQNARFRPAASPFIPAWRLLIASLLSLALAAGCASTKVSDRQEYQGGKLPRPARIIVYDYAVTPADIPAWAQSHDAYSDAGAPMTADELAEGRKLGADVAKELVEKINKTGMVAVRSEGQAAPQLNDIVLVGYFTSVDEGSATERMLVGFGKGAANVGAHAEGYHMTDTGLVVLGSGDIDSGGGKSPGLVVPTIVTIATHNPIGLVVSGAVKGVGEATGKSGAKGSADRIASEIAKVLEQRFQEQGWI